ncbi:MAG: glycosyltransferase [Planctomycetes bacterium]|nr:glycosyltransferase [Planctomycetota bacterium]
MNRSPPVISIIMPCFNEAKRISRAIETVFNQSFSAFELLVIDDESTDESIEVLNSLSATYSTLHYFSQSKKGAGAARNLGLKKASGEMIAFLDADDSWDPECLAKLHSQLEDTPDAALAYCGWQNVGLTDKRNQPFVPPDYESPNKIETLLRGCRWPIHAALTRHSVLKKIGGFDERWTSCMDYDLWLRIASFNKIVLVPEVLAYYHHHDGEQITKNKLRIALNHLSIQQKFVQDFPEIIKILGQSRVREIIGSELLTRAYTSYWSRDLKTAHVLFRKVLSQLYLKPRDLKYLFPALLPYRSYRLLIEQFDK